MTLWSQQFELSVLLPIMHNTVLAGADFIKFNLMPALFITFQLSGPWPLTRPLTWHIGAFELFNNHIQPSACRTYNRISFTYFYFLNVVLSDLWTPLYGSDSWIRQGPERSAVSLVRIWLARSNLNSDSDEDAATNCLSVTLKQSFKDKCQSLIWWGGKVTSISVSIQQDFKRFQASINDTMSSMFMFSVILVNVTVIKSNLSEKIDK